MHSDDAPRRKHPWLRRIGIAIGVLFALVLVAIAGALIYVSTDAGGNRLRRFVVAKANDALMGRVGIQRLELHGGHLHLWGVSLSDPAGHEVAHVDELEARLALGQLVHKRIDLKLVRIETPALHVVQTPDGSNFQAALAPRHPKPKEPSSGKSSWGFAVDALQLDRGLVDLVQQNDQGERHVRIEDLRGRGSAELTPEALAANVRLDAGLRDPIEGPVAVRLTAHGSGDAKDAEVRLSLGGADLLARVHAPDADHAVVKLETLDLPPELAQAFLPSYPLTVPAHASGELRKSGERASVALKAQAGSAVAVLEGEVNLATKNSDGVHLRVRHLNFAELTENGPSSDVAIELDAAGGGTSAEDAHGWAKLTVPPSLMGGQPMGPVRLHATAEQGRIDLKELTVALPGVALQATGHLAHQRLALSGQLTARDLAAFSNTLGRLGKKKLALSGSGTLTFSAQGPLRDPAVQLDGTFPSLRLADKQVSQLALHAHLPAVKRPDGAQVSVDAKRLALGSDKRFEAVHVGVQGHGREVHLDVAARGQTPLALTADAALDRDNHGAELKTFSLRYPEASWSLAAPVRVRAEGKSLNVGRLELRADRQSIALEALKRGNELHAKVSVHALDLARLPKALVAPRLRLAGRLEVAARAEGTARAPDVSAKVDLTGGRFKKYSNVELHLDASYVKERAKGQLAAHGVGVNVDATFDLPVRELKTGGHAPVHLDATIAQFDLQEVMRNLGIDKPVRGLASAKLSLTGTASDPRLDLSASLKRLQLRQAPPADLELTAKSAKGGKLGAKVNLTLASKESAISLDTPFTLGELIRKPLHKDQLLAAPIRLDADVREFPLEALYAAGVGSQPVEGTLSAQARLHGPAGSPQGQLSVVALGLSKAGARPVDAKTKIELGEDVRAAFDLVQESDVLIHATARVGASPGALRNRETLTSAPVSLDGTVGPLELADLQKLLQPNDDPAEQMAPLAGTLEGKLHASGSLRDPKLELQGQVTKLSFNHQKETGEIALRFDYAHAKEALTLALHSQNGGKLEVDGNAGLDLSFAPGERRELKSVPVSANLVADKFDPAFLGHATQLVERLGGQLDGRGTLSGTIGAPRAQGQLEWKNGVLETDGFGDFHDLHLLAHASNDKLQLDDLSMKSGKGSAKLSALAERAGDRFNVHAKADLDKFPVMSQGELLATVSLKSTAEGNATRSKLFIRSLAIPEAHVQLPDVKRKNLQKLDKPDSIVLTRNGKPIKGQKLQEAEESPEATGVGGAGSAGIEPAFNAVVKVNAPRNLWIQGNDIDTEIGLSDNFRIEYAGTPQIFGDVHLLRGRLEVFGRRFDWDKNSKVTFGGPLLEPELDVTAIYKNETEQVTVYLKAQGSGDKVKLSPTSDPPLSDTEIYTLLATGHTSLHHGSGNTSPSGEAASLVGSFAAGQLKKTLSSVLPLDVFSIEAGDQGLEGTKLEAGTYVNDRLYFGFTGRVGADPMKGENSNQVDMEYQISKRWSIQGSYGDAQAGDLNLIWQKDY
jgi:translocation and assembly module TamB